MTHLTTAWGDLDLGAACVVRAWGEFDLATAPAIAQRLSEAAPPQHSAAHVVVDLADVTFMDCAGLGVLVAAQVRLDDRLWLLNPSAPVCRLLHLTGLQDAFRVLRILSPARGLRSVSLAHPSA